MKMTSSLQSTIWIVFGVTLSLAGCASQERGDLEAVNAAINQI